MRQTKPYTASALVALIFAVAAVFFLGGEAKAREAAPRPCPLATEPVAARRPPAPGLPAALRPPARARELPRPAAILRRNGAGAHLRR